MLVLSRECGNSIMVLGPEGGCLITVMSIRDDVVSILVSHGPESRQFESWTVTMMRDKTVRVGSTAEVTLIDVRGDKVRIGINASKDSSVHRLEVWEAIQHERRRAFGGDDAGGLTGSRVPRPNDPPPPSLDVRLNEPPPQ